MTTATLTLREEITALARAYRWRGALTGLARGLWVLLAAVLLFVYADVVIAFSSHARVVLDLLVISAAMVSGYWLFRRTTRSRSRARMIARLAESGNPDLGNDLVNALDFEERIAGHEAGAFSPELMQAEIDTAAARIRGLTNRTFLRPASLRSESVTLACTGVIALMLPFLFPHVFGAVIPRLADPYGDHPPYCPTQFKVEPGAASLDYGEDLLVNVTTSGRRADNVTLVVEDTNGRQVGALAMLQSGEHQFFQTIEGAREDSRYYARIEGGRSKRYPLTITKTPRIEYASVRFDYPSYTGLPSKTRLLGDAPIKAYAGTEVTLTLSSNRPLRGGPLTINGQSIAMSPSSEPNVVSGQFTLDSAGSFTAYIEDVDGRKSKDGLEGTLALMTDNPPQVNVVSPGRHSFAIPDAKVPIAVEASDDLGVTRVDLLRSHNASTDDHVSMFETDAVQTIAGGMIELDLAKLGVNPGDVLEYYATATDTRPDAPQTSASPSFQLRVISFEEYQNFMQSEMTAEDLKDKYDAMLEQIAAVANEQEAVERATKEMMDKLAAGETLTEHEEQKLAELQGRQRDLAAEADRLGEMLAQQAQAPAVFDIEKEYKEVLSEIAQRLQEAGNHMRNSEQQLGEANQSPGAAQASLASAAEDQRKALDELGRQLQQFQEGIQQANNDLEKIYKLLEDVEKFKHLYGLQQGVERQARTYQEIEAPSLDERVRLKEIAEQESAIEDALNELKAQLREHAKEVEADYPVVAEDAIDIANQIDSRGIEPIMARASGELSAGDAVQGHPSAKNALDEMEAMIQFCEASAGNGTSQCELRLQIQMAMNPGNTLGQFGQSLSNSAGNNFGGFGMGAGGQGGMSAGSVPFNMYGSESFGKPTDRESPGGKRRMSDAKPGPDEQDPLAGSIEELPPQTSTDIEFADGQGEHLMEEYRGLIEAYFQAIADERR